MTLKELKADFFKNFSKTDVQRNNRLQPQVERIVEELAKKYDLHPVHIRLIVSSPFAFFRAFRLKYDKVAESFVIMRIPSFGVFFPMAKKIDEYVRS